MTILIDRMEIDDVGGNPAKLATTVLGQIADLAPPIPVREIAEALDIYEIREEPLSGLEGGLITPDDKSEGAILVNASRPERRKRFTIGHELGHYLNPWHKPKTPAGFRCSSRDMAAEAFKAGDRAIQMEVEANEFAAELLMPKQIVKLALQSRAELDLEDVLSLADDFLVSREAMARRYISSIDEPAAVVFSRDGVIRYVKMHPSFPRLEVWNGDQLPATSLSVRSSLPVGELSTWDEVDGTIWLRGFGGTKVCEQTLSQQNGFRITLLALDELSDEEVDQNDDEWEEPRFRR